MSSLESKVDDSCLNREGKFIGLHLTFYWGGKNVNSFAYNRNF